MNSILQMGTRPPNRSLRRVMGGLCSKKNSAGVRMGVAVRSASKIAHSIGLRD